VRIANLAAAARRGVNVTITMTADSEWDQAFAELARAGAHIRLYRDVSSALYIHAKAIVADAGRAGQRVLVGSQNFSVASLDYNRELGIRTRAPAAVAAISATLTGDYAAATPYSTSTASRPGKATSSAWSTATAGSYSHTYRTNGSGYALIYLNGPPPGARITVTVGNATCTTSD
jgi:phosphatidylserine/phosphatidylglycerophosphate/cardiolipin synthase-like enzyme